MRRLLELVRVGGERERRARAEMHRETRLEAREPPHERIDLTLWSFGWGSRASFA